MILGSLILDQRNRKVFIYMLLILFCLFTTSCIKQMNLYQGDKEEDENGGNASTNQEVICEPDFLYPFDKRPNMYKQKLLYILKQSCRMYKQ